MSGHGDVLRQRACDLRAGATIAPPKPAVFSDGSGQSTEPFEVASVESSLGGGWWRDVRSTDGRFLSLYWDERVAVLAPESSR